MKKMYDRFLWILDCIISKGMFPFLNKLFPSCDYDYELISKFRERLKNRLEIIKCDKYICSKWRQEFTDNVLYTIPWNFEVSAF